MHTKYEISCFQSNRNAALYSSKLCNCNARVKQEPLTPPIICHSQILWRVKHRTLAVDVKRVTEQYVLRFQYRIK